MSQPALKEKPVLNRQHFTTSRMMEFFSEKELTAQTGHRRDDWGAVVLKEAIDNEYPCRCPEYADKYAVHICNSVDGVACYDDLLS